MIVLGINWFIISVDYIRVRRDCCQPEGLKDPRCIPIDVPEDDPYLKVTNIRCLNFSRAETFQDMGCAPKTLDPEQVCLITEHIFICLGT